MRKFETRRKAQRLRKADSHGQSQGAPHFSLGQQKA